MMLPDRINAIRAVSYEVTDEMIQDAAETFGVEEGDVTADMLVDLVAEWAMDDLVSAPTIYQDQDGWEL